MKKGTKILSLFVLGLFTVIIAAGLISAITAAEAGSNANSFFKGAGEFINGMLGVNNVPIQRLFLAVLLTMVLYSVIKDLFGQNEGISWTISIVIAALSLSILSEGLIDAIAIQYGAMGAAILTVIPLIIMLIFTMSTGSLLIARISWLFYVIYYFFLYLAGIANDSFTTSASWYYLAAIIVGCVMFFSASFFRGLLFHGKLEAAEEKAIKDIKFRALGRDVERKETESRTGEKAPIHHKSYG